MSAAGVPLDRPRSIRIHGEILAATAALLGEGGLAAATTDAIVARCGASKTTVYKHWPTRLALAVDAFAEQMAGDVPGPDTGDTAEDLREYLRRVCAYYRGPAGRVYAELLAASVTDEGAAELLRSRFLDGRRVVVRQVYDRGVARGEIRPDLDFQAVNDVLFGPIIFRLISGHAPLDEDQADLLADVVLRGVLR